MEFKPSLLPALIEAVNEIIETHTEEVTALDQAIGDGDHVINLKRGLQALLLQREVIGQLDWCSAWQKIGMSLMSTVGGASGSLYGTLFVSMGQTARDKSLDLAGFVSAFSEGVNAVKRRGRTEVGEKTLVDVLQPVAEYLQLALIQPVEILELLQAINDVAFVGMTSTEAMVATKGRASFLGERSVGHIDAGAKTSQLIISAIVHALTKQLATPS